MRANDRPNILVFLTDDHAQWALGPYGHEAVRSPAMDWLAREGAVMENAFTPGPVCSPARASFWTGLMPSAHGIHDWICEPFADAAQSYLLERTTLASRLRDAGYRTGISGKWHAGNCNTVHRGFDRWFVNERTRAAHGDQRFSDQGTWVDRFGHQAPMITEQALGFLDTWHADARGDGSSERPFFLFVGYTDTHTPLNCLPEGLVAYYRADPRVRAITEAFSEDHGRLRFKPYDDPDRAREQVCQYLAAVTWINEQMTAIFDRLAVMGELDRTLIVYTSDHGHGNGYRGIQTKGNSTIPQNFLEPSIRVPLLLRWPGVIEAGARHAGMVDHCDSFATLLDAAGLCGGEMDIDVDGDVSPGRSYLPALRAGGSPGQAAEAKAVQYSEYGNARMARTPGLKYIERYAGPNGRFDDELYDLADDPLESRNVLHEPGYADRAEVLRAGLHSFFDRYQNEACRGDRIAELPLCTPVSPWSEPEDAPAVTQP